MVVGTHIGKGIKAAGQQADDVVAARLAGNTAKRDAATALTAEEIAALQMQADSPGALGILEKVINAPLDIRVIAGGAALGMVGEKIARSGTSRGKGWMTKIGDVMAFPKRVYSNVSFADAGEKLGIGKFFSKISQPVFDGIGAVADTVGRATGFNKWRAGAHARKLDKLYPEAVAMANGMDLSHAPTDEIRNALHEIKSAVVDVGSAAGIDSARLTSAKHSLDRALAAHPDVLSKETKALLGNASHIVENVGHHSGRIAHYGNVRKSWSNASGKVANTAIGHGLMHGSFVALSALSMAQDTKSFAGKLTGLRLMYTDMTGEKDISTLGLLFGSVPAPVAAARKTLLANFTIKQLLDTVNIGLNIKNNRMGMMASMLAFTGVGMLSSGTDAVLNTSSLPFYKGMSDAHKAGKNISAEAYAEFLTLESKELERSGKDNAMVLKLAEQYAAEQIAPGALLKEIESGAMMKRVQGIIADNQAKAPNAAVSQVAKLQGAPQAAQPVMGVHTAKVNAQTQAAQGTIRTV